MPAAARTAPNRSPRLGTRRCAAQRAKRYGNGSDDNALAVVEAQSHSAVSSRSRRNRNPGLNTVGASAQRATATGADSTVALSALRSAAAPCRTQANPPRQSARARRRGVWSRRQRDTDEHARRVVPWPLHEQPVQQAQRQWHWRQQRDDRGQDTHGHNGAVLVVINARTGPETGVAAVSAETITVGVPPDTTPLRGSM